MPRINFVSFTFLFAFGFGAFAGIGMALFAVAIATTEPEDIVVTEEPQAVADTPTPTWTAVTPTGTPSPTPIPVVRTESTQQVRIGPNEDYAVLGTLASGSEIDVQGRDDQANWVAFAFPPGSAARGWIPVDVVDGLTLTQVFALEVVAVTLVDTTPRFPGTNGEPTVIEGDDSLPIDDATPGAPSGTATPTETPEGGPSSTPTPRTVQVGPTDLSIGGYAVSPSGAVTVTVVNEGPGDIPAGLLAVQVTAGGSEVEFLRTSRPLFAGDSTTLRTTAIRLTASTSVRLEIDANRQLSDTDRSNNSLRLTLTP